MTPKERIRAAMNLEPVDRTPLMCQMSIGHMLIQLKVSPSEFWFDPKIFADGLLKLREQYGFDGILISLHGHDPDWRKKIKRITVDENGETIEWINSDKTVCPFNELPIEYKNTQQPKYDLDVFDIHSLSSTLDYIPVSQGLHFNLDHNHLFDVYYDIIKRAGKVYSIHGELTSPFDYLFDLIGIQDSLIGLICNPSKVKDILKHYTTLIIGLAREMCETGIDAVKISSPFAGAGFISPEHYSEFVVPYEKQVVQVIRELGVHAYIHTCGHISDRLELMFKTGISGIECLDPPPIGNVELLDAVARIKNKGFIKGNLDSVNLLLNSTKEEIISDVENRLKTTKDFPGFILSTACSIAPQVKTENVLLLREIIDHLK